MGGKGGGSVCHSSGLPLLPWIHTYLHGLCLTATLSRYSPFLSFLESQKGQL